jgi:hypothetical protein
MEIQPRADTPRVLPGGLWARMRADPLHAPEHLALSAVERLGPEARDAVADLRRSGTSDDRLARSVRRRFTRQARYSGAAAGIFGLPGAVVDLGVLAWTQARMALHIAAVYGKDPTDRERAAELLVLQNVHPFVAAADTALDVAAGRAMPSQLLDHATWSNVELAKSLANMVTQHAARRSLVKVVPLLAVPLGAMVNAGATKRLADRAIELYREDSLRQ